MSILHTIANKTRERVAADKAQVSLECMRKRAQELAAAELEVNAAAGLCDASGKPVFAFPFYQALSGAELSFICEVKKASPSKGVIAQDFPYLDIARDYERAGAAAISCLTEPFWFQGADAYLQSIAQELSIPVLRKDFVVDEYMIYQAKVLGAQAVLLICAILTDQQLAAFHACAESLGLSVLVEAHDEQEIERALAAGARIVGVNNRNLHDFSVDFNNAKQLRAAIPEGVIYVAESGVKSPDDVKTIAAMGANAALVGEALMRSSNRPQLMERFRQAACEGSAGVAALTAGASGSAGATAMASAGGAAGVGAAAGVGNAADSAAPADEACGCCADAECASDALAPVKFCGLSQPDDLAAINELLPQYVGLVFWEHSKRAVNPREAAVLRAGLDQRIRTVGVFVDAPVDFIVQLFNKGVISVAQLHGTETSHDIEALRAAAPGLEIWKAFELPRSNDAEAEGSTKTQPAQDVQVAQVGRVLNGEQDASPTEAAAAKVLQDIAACPANMVLLDAGKGQGMRCNWALLKKLDRPYVLAGGLDAQAVVQARAAGLRPCVFDVSSGIEAGERALDGRPRKDRNLMAAFVRAVGK